MSGCEFGTFSWESCVRLRVWHLKLGGSPVSGCEFGTFSWEGALCQADSLAPSVGREPCVRLRVWHLQLGGSPVSG